MKVYKIVFDGGPCSAKSTGIERVAEYLRKRGYIVVAVPEAATILKAGGITVENIGNFEFQKANFETQVHNEKIWTRYAEILSETESKDAVILCDRGKLSGGAYLPGFSEFLFSEYDLLLEDIHKEYDGVFHLVTAAIGAEEYFGNATNPQRKEDLEGARVLDPKSLEAWNGHTYIRSFKNRNEDGSRITMDQKIDSVIEHICRDILGLVDEPEKSTQEIEKEAKSMLTFEEYLKLIAYLNLGKESPKRQINSYYDTEDLQLNALGGMLRSREKKGTYELTVKEPAGGGGKLETNHRPFTDDERLALNTLHVIPEGNVKETLTRLNLADQIFIYQGQLTTDRIETPYHKCKLALDDNTYFKKQDYEIEMEKVNAADTDVDEKQLLIDLLNEVGIEYKPALNKSQRMYDELKRLNQN